MTADVEVSVAQEETDKRYTGDIHISISGQPPVDFSFEFFNPNDLNKFEMILYENDAEILRHYGARGLKDQLDGFTTKQVTLFAVLFRAISLGVKECQRVYGGVTTANPLQAHVEEAIRFIGKEPVASIKFSQTLRWRERDMFEFFAKMLRS